jgi:hypothetical protein
MTRISQSDHLLALLREQLRRVDRGRAGPVSPTSRAGSATPPARARMKALASLDSLEEEEVRRALVRALLTEQLGDGVAGDPGLQTIFDEVYRIISESSEGRALLERAAGQIREGGG